MIYKVTIFDIFKSYYGTSILQTSIKKIAHFRYCEQVFCMRVLLEEETVKVAEVTISTFGFPTVENILSLSPGIAHCMACR